MDLNIENYTTTELMTILNITSLSEEGVTSTCKQYIQKFNALGDTKMVKFFSQMESKLLI